LERWNVKPYSLSVDRITIVGKMKARKTGKSTKVGRENKIDEIDSRVMEMLRGETDAYGHKINFLNDDFWINIRAFPDYTSPIYNWRFHLGDHVFIQVNTGVDRDGNNFRIEWNPNLIEEWERVYIYELLQHVELKRYTKLDLAMDFSVDISKWEIVDEKERKRRRYESGKGKLESRYFGTHHSDVETKVYDKIQERKERGKKEISGVWWRIEETIRKKAVENWEEHEWFEGVVLRKGKRKYREVDQVEFPPDMKPVEKAKIVACMVMPELIEEFSHPVQRKIKKRIKDLTLVEKIESEFRPSDYIKEKMSSDLAEIKKTLKKIINL
jgi:hypothetical protein